VCALRNLIENGLRHGGGKVEVRLSVHGPRAVVRIEDRGPGVPEALRPARTAGGSSCGRPNAARRSS